MEDISSLESALRSWTNDMPIIEESDNEEFNFENKSTAIIEKLKSKAGIITANAEKLKLLIKYNGVEFNRYIEKCPTRKISKSMLGVLQSCTSVNRVDLVFTCKNIIVLKNGYIAEEASYDKVKLADSKSLFIGRFKFSNKNCNIRELERLIKEIKEL